MELDEFIRSIEYKVRPYGLNEKARAMLSRFFREYNDYPNNFLAECVDIGIHQYFRYDEQGFLIIESAETFLNKLGGILYNRSRPTIERNERNLWHKYKQKFGENGYDDFQISLSNFIATTEKAKWPEEPVINTLDGIAKFVDDAENPDDVLSTIKNCTEAIVLPDEDV